ncbi:MAG: hypothetical protein ACD_65C00077G0004 [uncultured bacterium]|nr:MAG: hypothetical protein ACD_65C00077G0004 [uncultured bacterium]KKT02855.1 MAG: translation elongation factor Ts, elongation factor Ts [Candidatus Peregrinibacteria bacterium GW2011_GWF2_43_17]KKT19996.1 MAG: Elongation factor Ts [Candidatus Peregrinibacteria bacterium GW2011_GWA2_43_8]
MPVTLDQIKKLREETGVSTMACKKALEEANGDHAKAIEILRKKGEAKSEARAERTTSQGVVAIAKKSDKASIISLCCETDFVAKNADFAKSAQETADKVLSEGESFDITGTVSELSLKLGEKIEVKDKKLIEGKVIGIYVHSNKKFGTVVALDDGTEEIANNIAMHVTAMNPKYITPEEIPTTTVEKEKEIWVEQLKRENKPEKIWENIMKGKERKFREENSLTKQAFVKNPEITVEKLLGTAKIAKFVRLSI